MITYRNFYVKSHAITTPKINLKDLPGSAGRLDVLARCINSAFWLSYGIRKNVIFHTILYGKPNPPVYIRIEGNKLRKMSPDERNIAIFIKKALERMVDDREIESTPGVFVSKKSFFELLEENKDKDFYLLAEEGKHIKEVEISKKPFFFLGDYKDLEESEKNLLYEYGAIPISLGKKSYLSSHCIAIINWILDESYSIS